MLCHKIAVRLNARSFIAWMFAGCTSGEIQLSFRTNFVVDCRQNYPTSHYWCHTFFSNVWRRNANQTSGTEKRDHWRFQRSNVRQMGPTRWMDRTMQTTGEICPHRFRDGDAMLLKAEKINKLSSNCFPCPFRVVQKTWWWGAQAKLCLSQRVQCAWKCVRRCWRLNAREGEIRELKKLRLLLQRKRQFK